MSDNLQDFWLNAGTKSELGPEDQEFLDRLHRLGASDASFQKTGGDEHGSTYRLNIDDGSKLPDNPWGIGLYGLTSAGDAGKRQEHLLHPEAVKHDEMWGDTTPVANVRESRDATDVNVWGPLVMAAITGGAGLAAGAGVGAAEAGAAAGASEIGTGAFDMAGSVGAGMGTYGDAALAGTAGLGAEGTGAFDMGGSVGAGLDTYGDAAGALTTGEAGTGAMDMTGSQGTHIPGSETGNWGERMLERAGNNIVDRLNPDRLLYNAQQNLQDPQWWGKTAFRVARNLGGGSKTPAAGSTTTQQPPPSTTKGPQSTALANALRYYMKGY